jgi:hypothetical protein
MSKKPLIDPFIAMKPYYGDCLSAPSLLIIFFHKWSRHENFGFFSQVHIKRAVRTRRVFGWY